MMYIYMKKGQAASKGKGSQGEACRVRVGDTASGPELSNYYCNYH